MRRFRKYIANKLKRFNPPVSPTSTRSLPIRSAIGNDWEASQSAVNSRPDSRQPETVSPAYSLPEVGNSDSRPNPRRHDSVIASLELQASPPVIARHSDSDLSLTSPPEHDSDEDPEAEDEGFEEGWTYPINRRAYFYESNSSTHSRATEFKDIEGSYSVADILQTRAYFLQSTPLPAEIINLILDYASYWASETFTMNTGVKAHGLSSQQHVMVLRTTPLGLYLDKNASESDNCQIYGSADPEVLAWAPPRGESPFRKVEFHIRSHDQGWITFRDDENWKSPYDGADTWFDAYIEHTLLQQPDWSFQQIKSQDDIPPEGFRWSRQYHTQFSPEPDSCLAFACPGFLGQRDPWPHTDKPTCIARNRTAISTYEHHYFTWDYLDIPGGDLGNEESGKEKFGAVTTGKLVREMRVGDTIALWARARCRGWVNYVSNASITVFWAV